MIFRTTTFIVCIAAGTVSAEFSPFTWDEVEPKIWQEPYFVPQIQEQPDLQFETDPQNSLLQFGFEMGDLSNLDLNMGAEQ